MQQIEGGGYLLEDGTTFVNGVFRNPDGSMDRERTVKYWAGSRIGNQISNFGGGFSTDRVRIPESVYG